MENFDFVTVNVFSDIDSMVKMFTVPSPKLSTKDDPSLWLALLVTHTRDPFIGKVEQSLQASNWQCWTCKPDEEQFMESLLTLMPSVLLVDLRGRKTKEQWNKLKLSLLERRGLRYQQYHRLCNALSIALDHCESAIEICDHENHVLFVNNAYEQLTGCSRKEVLGTESSDLRRKSLPKNKLKLTNQDSKSSASEWKFVPADQHLENYLLGLFSHKIFLKRVEMDMKSMKVQSDFRLPPITILKKLVEAPLSQSNILKVVDLLQNVQKTSTLDEEVQNTIQKIVKILKSTELYSPLIPRFSYEDKIASDLFSGLVMNGPQKISANQRRTSLYEVMQNEKKKSSESHVLDADVRTDLKSLEWNFDVFTLEKLTMKRYGTNFKYNKYKCLNVRRRPLATLVMEIFQQWNVHEFLDCSLSCLDRWIQAIEANYHAENPYHNSTHAADVLQATAYFLSTPFLSNIIEHSDAVASLLAAAIHDVDHPGKTSTFLINTNHPLALMYNDLSVLENHHVAFAFNLTLTNTDLNIFSQLSRDAYISLRKRIVDMVLATDMMKHFEYLSKFKQTVLESGVFYNYNISSFFQEMSSRAEASSKLLNSVDPRRTVCQMLIKVADVSNPIRPWKFCKKWAYRIVEEYCNQTDEERAKSLPLTMEVFDRNTCNIPLTQCRFTDMFIREMMELWCRKNRFLSSQTMEIVRAF
ncbi:unnamed protein product [Soboliphyme baturini]|uniref:3',5'-cyclic-AMP phosphodiesterase n=1 Tax=Soboliphyme baturini TaxID=241478 RepID=A0A183IBC2_9BILA|nr:unnamed protein product [Soboliphyme baturini]